MSTTERRETDDPGCVCTHHHSSPENEEEREKPAQTEAVVLGALQSYVGHYDAQEHQEVVHCKAVQGPVSLVGKDLDSDKLRVNTERCLGCQLDVSSDVSQLLLCRWSEITPRN